MTDGSGAALAGLKRMTLRVTLQAACGTRRADFLADFPPRTFLASGAVAPLTTGMPVFTIPAFSAAMLSNRVPSICV